MLVSLLSLVGVPPLAGFIGKFALFVATMQAGYTWHMVLGQINSALSLFYYLRVVAPMFVPPAGARNAGADREGSGDLFGCGLDRSRHRRLRPA